MNISVKIRMVSALCALGIIVSFASEAAAGVSGAAEMIFPPNNYEIYLGDSITPVVRVWNFESTPSGPDTLRYTIRNVATNVAVYSRIVIVAGIRAGGSVDVDFYPYYTVGNNPSQLGTFDACLIWGDSDCSRLFGIRRTAVPFRDPGNGYTKAADADIPDQTLWTSLGATVVDGEDSTWDPPPPRGGPFGRGGLMSPVILLDRRDEAGNYYSGTGVGDTLNSFPINMQGKLDMDFMFDFMRGGKHHYSFGWDTSEMFGPETTILDSTGDVIRAGDSLILEFKKPSAPAENPGPKDWNEIAAIDGGHDFEFKSCNVYLWDTNSVRVSVDGKTTMLERTPNYFTSDFRFRLRLKASDNGAGSTKDDADPWYIDNPTWQWPNIPDFEVLWTRVVNPYTKVPRSQAIFPVYMKLHDYAFGSIGVFPFPIHVAILDSLGDTAYSQFIQFSFNNDTADTVIRFPDWDASNARFLNGAPYTVVASIDPNVDHNGDDNSTYTIFHLNVAEGPDAVQEFAYDGAGLTPSQDFGVPDSGNEIPKLTHVNGAGIGFPGTTGSFAVKFKLVTKDTLYGVRALFGSTNEGPDPVRISFYSGDSSSPIPDSAFVIPGIETNFAEVRGGPGQFFDHFTEYEPPKPLILPAGTYWVAISQLSKTNMELGGELSRGCGQLVAAGSQSPRITPVYNSQYGTQWGSNPNDDNGNIGCSFAIETPAGSGNWRPMMPDSGWWPAMDPASDLSPTIPGPNAAPWTGKGTYVPLIRVMLGNGVSEGVNPPARNQNLALRSFPDPFQPDDGVLAIECSLPVPAQTTLTIYNALGTHIRTITKAQMNAGEHRFAWDGRNTNGSFVPSGIYFVMLESAGGERAAKIVVGP